MNVWLIKTNRVELFGLFFNPFFNYFKGIILKTIKLIKQYILNEA